MSSTNRDDSGYARPQARPCGVSRPRSGSLVYTTRCRAYPAAYALGTVPVRQESMKPRSFGPLYQLVSILTGASLTSLAFIARSASVPSPNRSFGDAGVVVRVLGTGVGAGRGVGSGPAVPLDEVDPAADGGRWA